MTGKLLELLNRPALTDLCFNQYNQVYADEGAGMNVYDGDPIFTSENEYRTFVLEQISLSGKTWDAKLPFVDTVFFQTHRAHIAFPPMARTGIYLSLRRLPTADVREPEVAREDAYHRWKSSREVFDLLVEALRNHETIVIAGGTGSGKTTLLNDLLSFVEANERIITLEDTAEIRPGHAHFLSLLTRTANADGFGSVSLKELLRQTLRMRPDRLLIGECRGDEVLDLLQALNTGHRGTLTTVHANSARDALKRLELLALIAAKGTIPSHLIKELLSAGVQKIAYLARENGIRKIHTVLSLQGIERDVILTRTLGSRNEVV
jgi:pilus assembly protein CpaF